jgi:hypothetical protein
MSANRSTGERVAAVLTFSGAMILALGACASFVVGAMAATGDERGEPVSVAIAGMALGGGLMLLILAGAAGLVAFNTGELHEWARTVSFTESAAGLIEKLRGTAVALAAGVERGLRGVSVIVRQCGEFLRRRAHEFPWALHR